RRARGSLMAVGRTNHSPEAQGLDEGSASDPLHRKARQRVALVSKTLTWFVIVLVHGTVTIFAPFLLYALSQPFSDSLGALRFIGLVPITIGFLLMIWSGWSLAIAGKGTPAPFDPPKQLVVKGPYRFVRNPMYLGDLVVLLGESLLFESLILLVYSFAILAICYLWVTRCEEPVLKRKFVEA